MKDKIIIAGIAIGAFLLGTLMPRASETQEASVETEIVRDTITHSNVPSVPVEPPTSDKEKEIEFIYIPAPKADADTVWIHDTVWLKMPRQYYYAETDDVKIWHSGIDSRIDSLVNFRETKTILSEPWKRHSIDLSADVGFNMMGIGAEYEYNVSEWFSISANAGYDFYMKQPYVSAGAKIRLYSW